MLIRQKLSFGAMGLTMVPLVLTAMLLWRGAVEVASEAIGTQTETQLTALRDLKAQEVRAEIESRLTALRSLGANRATAEALKGFKGSFAAAGTELLRGDEAALQRQQMVEFVERQFNAEFAKRNPGAAPSLAEWIDKRDPATVALQHQFITANPNPLGEKDKASAAGARFAYNEQHAIWHPTMERTQKLHGFYDIFLIDTSNDKIVYTVFKELDFATSLASGIAAKSKLAEAYQKVKHAKSASDLYLTDFEPYLPSYNDQAAFAAVPIFDGERQIGVLAVQFPIDRITKAINSNQNWTGIGLGNTGDAYLVGPDRLLRTDVRDLLQGKEAFVNTLGERLSAAQKDLVLKKNTSIGLVNVNSQPVQEALAGRSGQGRFVDHRGIEMVGAWAPLKLGGLNWGVVTAVTAQEAAMPLEALNTSMLARVGGLAVVVIAVVGLLLSLFLRRFMKPIETLHSTVNKVAEGQTGERSRLAGADEIGQLGRAFDQLLDERIAALEATKTENEQLNNSVIALLQTVFQLSNKDLTVRAEVTEDVIGTLSSSINQLSDETGRTLAEVKRIAADVRAASQHVTLQAGQVDETAQHERQALEQMAGQLERATKQLTQVARLSDASNRTAEKASVATDAALRTVAATVRGMDELRESISETEKRFKRLGERSQEISSAVSLINTISERTHVLALNASMQAATAGEAGRGFAVVAEEVQRLSDSSRQATQQIAQLVQNIQIETNETIYTMNRLIASVVSQSDKAQQAGNEMGETRKTTAELVTMVQQIASFSDQQSLLARELQLAVVKLNRGSMATVSAISEQTRSTQSLLKASTRLIDAVSQFKVPEAEGGEAASPAAAAAAEPTQRSAGRRALADTQPAELAEAV
jgi:methyl-accepting chemotaxis protein